MLAGGGGVDPGDVKTAVHGDQQTHRPPIDVAAAATYLGVSERFIRRLIQERRIESFKIGRFRRFDPYVLDAFLDDCREDGFR
jgi:excisionase family DNA binding protein